MTESKWPGYIWLIIGFIFFISGLSTFGVSGHIIVGILLMFLAAIFLFGGFVYLWQTK